MAEGSEAEAPEEGLVAEDSAAEGWEADSAEADLAAEGSEGG